MKITPEARAHFRAGVNFLDDPDGARYGEAYREFKAAYALAPSWKILGNIGLTAMKLERDGEAIDAYRRYLKDGQTQIDKAERDQVQRDLQTLQAGVVTVTVKMEPVGTILIDERFPDFGSNVINRYEPRAARTELGLRPGRHRITARLDGHQDQSWTFETHDQRKFEHTFKLEKIAATPSEAPSPTPPALPRATKHSRPVPASVYVVGGLTVAAALGGAIVGSAASAKRSDYDTANANQKTPADHQKAATLRDEGQRLNLIADLCFVGAALGAGATIYLYTSRPSRTEQVGRVVRLMPVLGVDSAGAVVSGSF